MTKCNQRLINPHCYQGSSLPMHCFLLNKYLSADHTCCVTLLGIQATCSKLAEVNGKSLLSPPDHWLQNELEPSFSNQQPSPCYAPAWSRDWRGKALRKLHQAWSEGPRTQLNPCGCCCCRMSPILSCREQKGRAGWLGIHQLPKQRGGVSDNRHPPASWSTKPNWRKLFF